MKMSRFTLLASAMPLIAACTGSNIVTVAPAAISMPSSGSGTFVARVTDANAIDLCAVLVTFTVSDGALGSFAPPAQG